MNSRFHKVVFSKSRNSYVVVSEKASCLSGSGRTRGISAAVGDGLRSVTPLFFGLTLAFSLVASAWSGPAANALPTGATVAQGKVSVSQSGNTMTLTQSTDRAVVNFNSYDIGTSAKVNIVQPSANSAQLNRVTGNSPSKIMGQLTSNGQVVLVNPNGIVVGQDGSVSASAFTASTLGITDADFMAGKNNFTSDGSSGSVVNNGHIKTKEGNYVALLGASVTNNGTINAPEGSVYLGAAKAIAVPVTRSGKIKLELSADAVNAAVTNTANGSIVAASGQVYIQAGALNDAAAVSVSGKINVSGNKKNPQGGTVTILADAGQIDVSAAIKANHADPKKAGGEIIIGRDLQTGVLAAKTDVSRATLEAKGGFVETSAHYLKSDGVKVRAATWLIDPNDVEINETGVAQVEGNTVVTVASINEALNSGAQVIITTGTGVGSTSSVTIIPASGGTGTTNAIPVGTISAATPGTTMGATVGNTVASAVAVGTTGGAAGTNTGTASGTTTTTTAGTTTGAVTSSTAAGATTSTTAGTTTTGTTAGTTAGATAGTLTGATTGTSTALATSTSTTGGTAASTTTALTSVAPAVASSSASTTPVTTVAPAVIAIPTPVIVPVITQVARQTIGNITINADVSKISGGLASITFVANNSVVVASNKSIASSAGVLNVALTANAGNTGAGAVVLNTGASIASNGGNVSMTSSAAPAVGAGVQIAAGSNVTTSGGQVVLTAPSIQVAGTINTSAAKAGAVTVLAAAGQIAVSGVIKANSMGANAAPASIIIGRDLQTGVLAATTDVSGADLQAKGGLIETSGDFLKSDGVKIIAGTWLLDPVNVEINATATAETAGNSVVLASDINTALNAGTSVMISTGTGTSSSSTATGVSLTTGGTTQGNGNILMNENIAKTAGGDASLSLIASGNITFKANKSITASLGKLNVLLNANSGNTGGGILLSTGSGLTSNGGNITLGGGSALTGAGFATADGVSTLQGISMYTATINASGGNIVMNGKTAVTNYQGSLSNIAGIFMAGGSITTTGSGTIHLTAANQNTDTQSKGFELASGTITGGTTGAVTIVGDARGVGSSGSSYLRGALVSGTVTSAGGDVTITGYGGSGAQYDYGVDIGGSVTTVGTGALSINGTAGAGGSGGNVGVIISGVGTISSVDGAISITGLGGIGNGSQIRNHGVQISGSNAIRSTGSGGIAVTGRAVNNDTNFSQGVVVSGAGLRTMSGDIKLDGQVLNNYQVAVNISSAVTATTGNVYVRSVSAGIANSATGVISGRNVSIDNTGGTIDANGVITTGSGFATTWIGQVARNGIDLAGSVTAANNLNIYGYQNNVDTGVRISGSTTVSGANVTLYGRSGTTGSGVLLSGATATLSGTNLNLNGVSSSGNGVLLSGATLSGDYLNVTGASATGYNGFAWSGGTIKTTGTGGINAASTVTGTSAASTTASNGYGAFMTYGSGALSAVSGTSLSLVGQATTLTTGQNTKERGILVRSGDVLTASGDITLDGTSKSSEGISFGGTINMTTVAGVTNKLTIRGTAAASSNSSLNALNISGAINGNAATSSINIIGDAKNLSGSSTDNAVNISGLITGSTANVNVQSTRATILTSAGISGANISIDNSNGTINALTGAITAGAGSAGSKTGVSIGGNLTATGNLNIYGASANTGVNIAAAIVGTTSTSSTAAINIQSNGNIVDSSSITSSGTGGITITAGDGTAASTAAFTASNVATITQAGTGNVIVSTSGQGNLTTAKISHTGTGNVTLAAGSAIAAAIATGGQVLTTHAANTVSLADGRLYVYSGAISGLATNTGNLSVLNSGFNNLSLAGSGITPNAQFNTAYGVATTIAGGATTQVMFRENTLPTAFDLTLNNISKVYGTSDLTGTHLKTALNAAYTGNATLTKVTGNNTFAMAAATAIAGLDVSAAKRTAGENVNGGAVYAYSGVSGASQNVSLTSQPGLLITPKTLSITANTITSTYDGVSSYQALATTAGVSTVGLVNATVDGVTIADTVTGVSSAFFSGLTIGSGSSITNSAIAQAGNFNRTISAATGTGLDNYTITYVGNTGSIAQANLTVSLQNTVTKQYDGNTTATLNTANYSIGGWVGGQGGSISRTSGAYTSQNVVANTLATPGAVTVNLIVGDYVANAGTSMSNYALPAIATGNVGVITAAPLVITVADRTLFVTQDPAPVALPCNPCISYEGFKNTDTAVNALSAIPTVVYSGGATPVVGTYNGVYRLNATPTNSNYSINVVNGKLTVIPAGVLLITIPTAADTVYGSTTVANAGAIAQGVTAQYLQTAGGSVISSLVMQYLGAGQWRATDATNTSVTFTLGVSAKPSSTLVPSSAGKLQVGVYDFSSSQIQPITTPNFSGSAVSAGSLAITPLAVTLNAGTVSKVYNQSASLSNVALAAQGVVAGDNVVATASTGAFVSRDAGLNIAYTLNGLALSGTDAANYSMGVTSLNGNGTISRAPLTISGITAASKPYDGSTVATVSIGNVLMPQLLAGDNVTVNSTGVFVIKNAGNRQVNLTNIYGGTSLNNYAITDQLTTTATITPIALNVSDVTANNKTYDGTTAASINTSGAVLTGLIAGDQVVVSGSGVFADPTVGDNKQVVLSLLETGADVTNYVITNQSFTTANISSVAGTSGGGGGSVDPADPANPVELVNPVKPIMIPTDLAASLSGSSASFLEISTFINPLTGVVFPDSATANSRGVITTANSLSSFSLASIDQNICSVDNPIGCECEPEGSGIELCIFPEELAEKK